MFREQARSHNDVNPTNVEHIGVLLAAGAGTRFGGAYPGAKLDQLIDGVSVGVRSFENLAAHVDAMIVVVRDLNSSLAQHARACGAHVIVNDEPERGIGHSLSLAINAIPALNIDAQFVWATLADMPFINNNTFKRLRPSELGGKDRSLYSIMQPIYSASDLESATEKQREQHGKPGHPVVFGRAHFAALAALDGDVGAREIIRTNREHVVQIATNDDGIWRDVDTAADLN
jgi:molybdenum cofactor cytidylyltransferase